MYRRPLIYQKPPSAHRQLVEEIEHFYIDTKQTREEFNLMMKYKDILTSRIEWIFERLHISTRSFEVLPTGSSMTELGSLNSDMDFCIWIFDKEEDEENDWGRRSRQYSRNQRRHDDRYTIGYLSRAILDDLYEHAKEDFGELLSNEYINAKIPLHRFVIAENKKQLDISVSFSECVPYAYSAAYFLQACCCCSHQFTMLCTLVKEWANINQIKDPPNGFFNGYSLVMMLVFYLQFIEKPAVLPHLIERFPDRYGPHIRLDQIHFDNTLPRRLSLPSSQKSVAELFRGFTCYFASFDWENYAISMMRGIVDRNSRDRITRFNRKAIVIEDYFDRDNPARSVKHENLRHISACFEHTSQLFGRYGQPWPTLDEIFNDVWLR